MTICDDCIHRNICADEGYRDKALKICADKVEDTQLKYYIKIIQDMKIIKEAIN